MLKWPHLLIWTQAGKASGGSSDEVVTYEEAVSDPEVYRLVKESLGVDNETPKEELGPDGEPVWAGKTLFQLFSQPQEDIAQENVAQESDGQSSRTDSSSTTSSTSSENELFDHFDLRHNQASTSQVSKQSSGYFYH